MNPITLEHPKDDRFGILDEIDDRLFRPAVLRNYCALTSFSGEIATLDHHLAQGLADRNMRLVIAESCTAGLLAGCVAVTPNSPAVLEGSFVTFRPSMKIDALGVSDALIRERTVYDADVACQMAQGAIDRAKAANLAIAITGVAGSGTDQDKPPRLFYIAIAHRGRSPEATECQFNGKPKEVLAATVCAAAPGDLNRRRRGCRAGRDRGRQGERCLQGSPR